MLEQSIKMNSFLNIFLCLAVLAIAECLTPEAREKLMELHKECAAETGVTDETAIKALEGDIPNDANFKEHLFCVHKIIDFQNEAGELQPDVIKEKLKLGITDEAKYNEMISKCINQKSTPQETAFEMAKCMSAIKHA